MGTYKALNPGNNNEGGALHLWLNEHAGEQNIVIRGAGSGVTFINFPVVIDGWRPKISGVTFNPPAGAIGLSLVNTAESLLDDVWFNVPAGSLGLWCGLKISGRLTTQISWPLRGVGKEAGSRVYMPSFRDVHMLGDGDGWRFDSDYEWANYPGGELGQFMNHPIIWGGHTYVKGQGMYLNTVKAMCLYGHHMDCAPYCGIHIEDNCRNIQWFGSIPEGNGQCKREKLPWITGRYQELKCSQWASMQFPDDQYGNLIAFGQKPSTETDE